MDKRYQVFVSSTFTDLEEERREILQALLELDCIPSGMELFPAANMTQWELIKGLIDDCDYYLVIVGGRYGSIGPEGISYTEMEFRYALSIGKPTIGFLHKQPGDIAVKNSEKTAEGLAMLESFRHLVGQKNCKFWTNAADLGSVASRSLVQLMRREPAVGWVRANELATHEATTELLQLRKRVDELQNQLLKARVSAPSGADALAKGSDTLTIDFTYRATNGLGKAFTRGSSFSASWNAIFSQIAPMMIHEATEEAIKGALDTFAGRFNSHRLFALDVNKNHKLGYLKIESDAFQTIKVQLRALGLIARSDKARSVKDVGTYWTLTPYGDEVMTQLLAIKSPGLAASDSDSAEMPSYGASTDDEPTAPEISVEVSAPHVRDDETT